MAASNFKIKYNAMDQLYITAGKRISEWNKELDNWSKSYNQIVNMGTFQGVSATGAKIYLSEVHGVLLYAIQQAFASYMSRLLLYKQGYYSIDSNLYASLPEEKMKDLANRLSKEASELEGISRDIGSSLNSISDIIPLPNPSKDYLQSNLEGLKKDIDSFSDRVSDYESSQYNSANGDLKSLIDALERTVKECYNSGANIASYAMGSIAHSSNVLELVNYVNKENEYIKGNAETIKIAGDKQAEQFKQMQKDYEAACKARAEQGAEKIIKGTLGVLVGVGAIICTAGAAAPLVVTVAVCGVGGCSAAYGLSSGTEGVQDVCHGLAGDLSAVSFNPIRDTIFCGNQSAYDTWGNISMTVSSFVIPAGKVLSSGTKGLQAVKLYGTEVVKDFTIGYGSSKITEYATDKLHLNGVESLGLNLGLNIGLYKATSFAGGKLNELSPKYRMKQRILANIEESRIAREASNYGEFAKFENEFNTKLEIKQRVLANIEASRLARESSGYKEWATEGVTQAEGKIKVPTVKSGEFNNWFNSLSVDELDSMWQNKSTRRAIERQLRAPGGMHEWHLVSRAPQFKNWGVNAEQIRDLRTAISDVEFINPVGKHGQLGSTTAHNELLGIIDSSIDYDMFTRRLNNWANYRLKGGVDALPEGLRLK
ncbi:MAG: T7SS effector LXG polymorphic toxin [Inconstantimicrobium porci]|uniref:T7SS effector LXG polymorphic toxin n=1 Tax=Inconstantimicrobium porci TaxID=2652291 RepID=UPI002A91D600|nr:T7SS effector LXG polymorphic toxin [Inconstantimicrobium porci]MDY5912263.1 T7SS effector LXG polymorphic toxin [Inconstantimicrobium porci]